MHNKFANNSVRNRPGVKHFTYEKEISSCKYNRMQGKRFKMDTIKSNFRIVNIHDFLFFSFFWVGVERIRFKTNDIFSNP